MTFQPYQEASKEIIRQQEAPGKALKRVGTLGAAALGGGSVVARALPFLSEFIPENLMVKGLSKIDPRFGKFINGAQEAGHGMDQIKEFLKEKLQGSSESNQEEPKEDRNIIQKYSDNLHQYILDLIKVGNSPLEAGIKAKKFLGEKEQKLIKQIENDYKTDWADLIESIYGGANKALPQQQSSQPSEQAQQSLSSQQQAPGQGQQALMSILQKLNQARGGK